MREPESCKIEYCGYTEPRTPDELIFETLGLKTAIMECQKRIAILEQSAHLVKITMESLNANNPSDKSE